MLLCMSAQWLSLELILRWLLLVQTPLYQFLQNFMHQSTSQAAAIIGEELPAVSVGKGAGGVPVDGLLLPQASQEGHNGFVTNQHATQCE